MKKKEKEKKEIKKEKDFIKRAWDAQRAIEERGDKIGKGKYGRALKMARKPEGEEYNKSCQITAIGILIVGAIGFAIYLISAHLAPWIAGLLEL